MIVAEDPEARSPLMTSLLVSLALGLSLASVVSAQVVVRAVDFADSPGPYTPAMLRGDWGNDAPIIDGLSEGRARIVTQGSNGVLRVAFPIGQFGPERTGIQFKTSVPPDEEYYLQYRLKFHTDFDFVRGGKLPGLMGGTAPTGCLTASESASGFTSRYMWKSLGAAILYLYWGDKTAPCGQAFALNVRFTPRVWYTLTQHVKLNTPGFYDGLVEVWVNDTEVFQKSDIRFRSAGAGWKITGMHFSTFFGGSDSSWATTKSEAIYFDDFSIWHR